MCSDAWWWNAEYCSPWENWNIYMGRSRRVVLERMSYLWCRTPLTTNNMYRRSWLHLWIDIFWASQSVLGCISCPTSRPVNSGAHVFLSLFPKSQTPRLLKLAATSEIIWCDPFSWTHEDIRAHMDCRKGLLRSGTDFWCSKWQGILSWLPSCNFRRQEDSNQTNDSFALPALQVQEPSTGEQTAPFLQPQWEEQFIP